MTFDWRKEAEEAGIPFAKVEKAARNIYHANWRELPNHRFPPVWENLSSEVRDYARRQAVRALKTGD